MKMKIKILRGVMVLLYIHRNFRLSLQDYTCKKVSLYWKLLTSMGVWSNRSSSADGGATTGFDGTGCYLMYSLNIYCIYSILYELKLLCISINKGV